jgi:hypothetical protein
MLEPNYHLSKKDLGLDVILKPKVPESSVISKEGNIPRVCVSNSLLLCLRSIVGCHAIMVDDLFYAFRDLSHYENAEEWKHNNGHFLHPVVYQSLEIPFLPPDASDFRINREKWYLKKTAFQRLGYLDLQRALHGEITIIEKPYLYRWDEFEHEFSSQFNEIIRFSRKKKSI